MKPVFLSFDKLMFFSGNSVGNEDENLNRRLTGASSSRNRALFLVVLLLTLMIVSTLNVIKSLALK